MHRLTLTEHLTDEFLTTLTEVARTIGHGAGDYHETVAFVQEVFHLAGKDIPSREDLTPYPAIDNTDLVNNSLA